MGLRGDLIIIDTKSYETLFGCHAKKEKKRCPICGSLNTKRKGFSYGFLTNERGNVRVKNQRYYCHSCGKSFNHRGYNKRRHYSSALKEKLVLDYVLSKSSLMETGIRYRVSKSSILNWLPEVSGKYLSINLLPMNCDCSGYVQFDGKFISINGRKYCLLHASDIHTNEPICYALYEKENKESAYCFLRLLKRVYPVKIRGIVSDFGKGRCFLKPIEDFFPEVSHQICVIHYLRYVNLFLPRTRRSQYFLRNRLMKSLIKNILLAPDRSESKFRFMMFNHFSPFFKAEYHRRFVRSLNKHYRLLTSYYDDKNLKSDTNSIENRNRQLERKLKNLDGFGSIENAKKFLQIWFHFEKRKLETKAE